MVDMNGKIQSAQMGYVVGKWDGPTGDLIPK